MPEFDWQQEKQWQTERMASGARRNHWWLLGMAAFVIALAMPATLAIPQELGKGNWAILSVLLFQLIGAGLLLAAGREWLAWQQFGEVHLHLSPWPAAIGGALAGHFELTPRLPDAHSITLSVECQRQQRGQRSNQLTTQWMRELQLQPLAPHERQIWFHFELPEGLPACTPRDSSHIKWTLTLRVRKAGPDLVRRFDIPVFAGEGDNPLARRRMRAIAPQHDEHIARDLHVTRRHNGLSLTQATGHAWKTALGLMLFGLACLASSLFLWRAGGLAVAMSLMFGGCAALLIMLALWLFGLRRDVLLANDYVATRLYWIGLPLSTRRVERDAVKGLQWRRIGSATSGTRSTLYYALQLGLKQAKPLDLCRGLATLEYTESAARMLSRETGIGLLGRV